MKNIVLIILTSLLFMSCTSTRKVSENIPKTTKSQAEKMNFEKNEDGEYDIIVSDGRYLSYLNSVARPKEYYNENYYKSRNIFYVTEWNIRNSNPLQYGDFYQVAIDYDSKIEYGYTFEYKLFNFFKFCEYQYGIKF